MSEKTPEVIGLGEIALDWVSRVPHFPAPDEKIDAVSQDFFVGGVTTNFLTVAKKLGASAGLIAGLGDDDYGEFLLKGLQRAGIDAQFTLKKGPTAVNFIMVAMDSGEKVIVQSPYFQTTKLDIGDIDGGYFKGAKVLHTTALHQDLTLHCIRLAREHGLKVSLDLEKQVAIRGEEALKPVIQMVDILLPNKEGARTLTGEKDLVAAAKKLLEWGPRIVVITLGADGCLVTTEEILESIPAFKEPVVDTTGAGDAFCATFIVAHVLRGLDVIEAAILANAVSAHKIQHLGATSGIPTWEEAMSYKEARL